MRSLVFGLLLTIPMLSFAGNTCDIEDPDPKGYLLLICNHIVENKIDVRPGKPNEYQIRKISETKHNGKYALLIHLSCCYLGDRAVIDPDTKKVLNFDLGDK